MKTNKIVFLDFDGVLVLYGHKADSRCVDALNHIVKRTGAKIVVSSAWRFGYSVEELRELLQKWGVVGDVIDKTPAIMRGPYLERIERGKEIADYLKLEPKDTKYAILDDDPYSQVVVHEKLVDSLVRTDARVGLTFKHAEKAINLLQ